MQTCAREERHVKMKVASKGLGRWLNWCLLCKQVILVSISTIHSKKPEFGGMHIYNPNTLGR